MEAQHIDLLPSIDVKPIPHRHFSQENFMDITMVSRIQQDRPLTRRQVALDLDLAVERRFRFLPCCQMQIHGCPDFNLRDIHTFMRSDRSQCQDYSRCY
jgi:hypothetical protein